MKVTVMNKRAPKSNSLFSSILLLILGVILAFNSDGFISIIFTILGSFVLFFGVIKFFKYYQMKKQFKVEQSELLMSAIFYILGGLLIIFLSNFIANTIQVVTGVWLVFLSISKLSQALEWKNTSQEQFIIEVVSSTLIFLLGIYTIVSNNVVFLFIGLALIIYSIFDIVNYFVRRK